MRRYLVLPAEPLAVVRVVLISLLYMEHIGEDALGRLAVPRLDIVFVIVLVVIDAADRANTAGILTIVLVVVVVVLLRSLDQEERRQHLDEHHPHPLGHAVGDGRTEVHVQHGYRDDHRQRHQHHGEQQILSQERHRERRGRYYLGQQQEEHRQREEYRDRQGDLLAAVARQVEHQHRQERYAHARYYQIHRVEEGLAAQGDVEHDVGIGFLAAYVERLVPHGRHFYDVPLDGDVIVGQVDPDVDLIRVLGLQEVPQVDLETR